MSNPLHSVAIVGVYNTEQARVLEAETSESILAKAVRGTIADAGLQPSDVNGICIGGAGPSAGDLIRQLGHHPSWASSGSGIPSLLETASAVATGLCDVALVASGQAGAYTARESTAPWTRPSNEFVESYGLFTAAEFALIAQRHMHEYGTKPEALAEVASAVRSNGAKNPAAVYFGREASPQDVLDSRMITSPFHLLDCCMTSEGGAGLLLTTVERARDMDVQPVYVLGGASEQQGTAYVEAPVWAKFGSSGRWGVERAFAMAGIKPSDVDVCEFYDNFSFELIRLFEAYGFCGEGEGGDFVMDGRTRIDGELPICTDGGLMSYSHAGSVQGLQRAIAGVLQIQGRAVNQVPDVNIVLTENYGAAALSTHCMIMGRDPA